jgi:hypothetical protein
MFNVAPSSCTVFRRAFSDPSDELIEENQLIMHNLKNAANKIPGWLAVSVGIFFVYVIACTLQTEIQPIQLLASGPWFRMKAAIPPKRRFDTSVSIIVPSLRDNLLAQDFDRLLPSIVKQSVLPQQVVVVMSEANEADCKQLRASATQMLPPSVALAVECVSRRLNQADARNFALTLAQGEVRIFSDADDPMHFQTVEILQTLFRENPSLQVVTHTYTPDPATLSKPLIYTSSAAATNLTSVLQSDQKLMWANKLLEVRSKKTFPGRQGCRLFPGMIPGAAAARRTATAKVPFLCSMTGQKEGSKCKSEDSLWLARVLEAFTAPKEVVHLDLSLSLYWPSAWWKNPGANIGTVKQNFAPTRRAVNLLRRRAGWTMCQEITDYP